MNKGDKVRVQYFRALPLGEWSLAGAQPKLALEEVNFVGELRHIRGDDPDNPTQVGLWVSSTEGRGTYCEKCLMWEQGPIKPKHVSRVE